LLTAFWNKSHSRDRERAADPLGLDSLREAMADCLVPHLTGGTRHAEDYLWILVGLRWARASAGTRVDAAVWEQFRIFERALKLYWQRFTPRRDYLGKRKVTELCRPDRARPSVNQPILTNERATGLLGSYVSSLRAIGLVDLDTLASDEKIIRGIDFHASTRTFTSWAALRAGFRTVESSIKVRRAALAPRLFGDDAMRRAAAAYLGRTQASSWSKCDLTTFTSEQRRVARACPLVLDVEALMVEAFSKLLVGATTLDAKTRNALRAAAAKARTHEPMPDKWMRHGIAVAIDAAWVRLGRGDEPEPVLLKLHHDVTKKVRGNDAWIRELGEHSLIEFRPSSTGRGFRFENLKRLVSQTRWQGHASRA
jgi:hypothetical protein